MLISSHIFSEGAKSTNWDAIGAVGEIIGALAVVISLLYLATQIKSQNRESRVAAMHDISVGFREATSKFATS